MTDLIVFLYSILANKKGDVNIRLPNGYGSINKMSGKRRKPYRVRVTIGWDSQGKQIYKELGSCETYAKALELLNLYHKNPNLIDNEKVTFKEIYDKWSKNKYPTLSYSSVYGYQICFKHCEELWDIPFQDIKLQALQRTVSNLKGKASMQKTLKGFLGLMYDFAIANDIVDKKYSDYIETENKITKIIRLPFSEEEIEKLWSSIQMKSVDIILILIYTGMRINELFDLKRENVDLDNNTLIGGSKTRAGINRIIPINHKIKPLIEKWYNNNNEYLVHNSIGTKIEYKNFISRDWTDIMTTLGMEHRPHDTRHTFATLMDDAGANKLCTKAIMGHHVKDITDGIYTHKTIERMKEAIEKI